MTIITVSLTLWNVLKSRIVPWVVVAILLTLFLNQCQQTSQANLAISTANQTTKFYRDKYGREHGIATVAQADLANFRVLHADIVDSLKKEIGTDKVDNVVVATREITDTVFVERDARGLILYNDKWTQMWQPDSSRLSYIIKDSLSFVTYNKRYGFLNLKKEYVTHVINYNPNVRMTGLKSYAIKPRDRRVGLGLSAGYAMTNSGLSPYVGAGIYYRLF